MTRIIKALVVTVAMAQAASAALPFSFFKKSGPPPSANPGGIYTGFTLSYFDDFTSSTVQAVGPGTPNSTYFMTRPYGLQSSGPGVEFRGLSTGELGYMTDPYHTGYMDENRGVPVGYTNVSQSGGVLTLQDRTATAGELPTLQDPAGAPNVMAILCGDGACKFFVTAGTAVIVEARIQFTAYGVPPQGWQPAWWTQSGAPMAFVTANEWDIFEFQPTDTNSKTHFINWVTRTNLSQGTQQNWVNGSAFDGKYHVYTMVLRNGGAQTQAYLDGALAFSYSHDGALYALPSYFIFSNFYNFPFSQSAWTAAGTSSTSGGLINIDWVRVWRTTGAPHYAPKVIVPDLKLAYNGTGSIVLPSATAIWGDGSVTEYVQCRPTEANEPGTTPTTSYQQFPSYITYNSGTRTLSVDFSPATGYAGIVHCIVDAWATNGSTDTPLRFNIYRGPNITTASPITGTHGTPFSYDFYFECDVGVVTPKVITIGNLPAGLTDNGNGTVTGTPVSSGNTSILISCTNNVGQLATKTVTLQIN